MTTIPDTNEAVSLVPATNISTELNQLSTILTTVTKL